MKNKYVYLDAEFNETTEANLNLVCMVTQLDDSPPRKWWLHNDADELEEDLVNYLFKLNAQGYIFVAYSVMAEARSILSMTLGNYLPSTFKWIDLYLEYRNLINHNHRFAYGDQYLNGNITTTKPPKGRWFVGEDKDNHSKTPTGLSGAVYKLLGEKIDTDHKTAMRDLIISNPKDFTLEEQKNIMDYCVEDVKYLPYLRKTMAKAYTMLYKAEDRTNMLEEMLTRGRFAARTAITEKLGYPINVEATRNFSNSVRPIINQTCREINKLFPNTFKYKLREDVFSMNQKDLRKWIIGQKFSYWPMTKPSKTYPKGQISLKLEAWEKKFSFRHTFPNDSLGAQVVRYLKLKQSLNGFVPPKEGAKKKTFWDSVGSDGRVRPFLNIYGSQTARNQPSATGFIPLKSAWMRSLIQPSKGKIIGNFDYGSEEFLIGGLLARDENMLKAYASGDVYLWFGKEVGVVPKNGTKKTHKLERDLCKGTTLGIGYDMTKYGLARRLTQDTGRIVNEEEAQGYINMYYDLFWKYKMYKENNLTKYRNDKYLKLPSGWTLFGNNPNERSVGNFPVQGFGSDVMRKAVELAQDYGLDVIYTLHDAIYIEFEIDDVWAMDILAKAMKEAFCFYFEGEMKTQAEMIRLDGYVWGPDFPEEEGIYKTWEGIECNRQQIYIDERAGEEYEKFKKFLDSRPEVDLL